MNKELTLIGKAKFKDFDAFMEWAKENAKKWVDLHWKDHLYNKQNLFPDFNKYLNKFKEFENTGMWYSENLPKDISLIYKNMVKAGTGCPIYYTEDLFSIIQFGGNKKNRFFVPTEFLVIEPLTDYSGIPISQLRLIRHGSAEAADTVDNALSTVSLNDVKSAMEEKLQKMGEIKNQMDDIKNARTGELKNLQDEIDRMKDELYQKKNDLLAQAQEKMSALEKVKSELEHQIFLLDSEIYSIRCFLGETVDFITLRTGQPAKVETPVVLYQKLHFLDEELGRMASLYNVQYGNYEQFEAFITHNNTAFETFCPAEKCITLLRVSRTGEYFSSHYNRNNSSMENILDVYDMEHGKMVGILIRNGENLYFGWTDEERISFGDDVFFTPGISEGAAGDDTYKHSTSKHEFASRYFVFSILQGVLESSKMLALPGKQSIFMPSEYIIGNIDTLLAVN